MLKEDAIENKSLFYAARSRSELDDKMLLRHIFLKVESDDKSKMPFGNPEKAVEAR
jgi:hypothetical protein